MDWFLVTANTSSFRWFEKEFSAHLHEHFRAVHISSGCQHYVHDAESKNASWAWRETAAGHLHFNLHRFPYIHGNLYGTLLIQHWQLFKCREMLRHREEALGFAYDRIVRFRTDVIFGRSGVRRSGNAEEAGVRHVRSPWLEQLQRPRETWVLLHDFFLAGSRRAMLEVALTGLEVLQTIPRLQGLQETWSHLRREAFRRFPKGKLDVFSCSAAMGCEVDLLRVAGPPKKQFFLQFTEVDHLQRCRFEPAEACWEQYENVWRLRPLELEPHNFTYDWPYSCSRGHLHTATAASNESIEECVARSHLHSFGAKNLIGDPKSKWRGKGEALAGVGRLVGYTSWVRNADTCAATDGWEPA